MNQQKIAKRKFYLSDWLSLYILWYEWNNFRVYVFFTSMHVLNFMFWVSVICINNEIGMIVWFGVIILQISRKRAPLKSWLDPRFSRNSKSKWTLKWLLLDRGYFKFYFHKGESILIISCHTYLLTRNFVFQIIFVLPCILLLFKMSRNLVLLIDHPSKRGDVETLAQSSISPSPQVKMKLKSTASR